jgi:hypothetical protein
MKPATDSGILRVRKFNLNDSWQPIWQGAIENLAYAYIIPEATSAVLFVLKMVPYKNLGYSI